MTLTSQPVLRLVTFGDLEAGLWGAAWSAPDAAFAIGSPGHARTGPTTIEGTGETADWHVSADGLALTVSPLGEPVGSDALEGFDQLARITGSARLGDGEVSVEGLGRRGLKTAAELDGSDSIRDVSCWFDPDQGFALTSVRPRKSRGHGRDVVGATILDLGGEHGVADPRLSTTYSADGIPVRAGLELWLSDDEETEQYPRRAAGEALSEGIVSASEGFEVRAEPFRWHSRGLEGCGVYLLMRPR